MKCTPCLQLTTKLFAIAVTAILLALIMPGGFADARTITSDKGSALSTQATTTASQSVAMNRLYNPNSGEHFYTASNAERDGLVKLGWNYEGTGWIAPKSSSTPVYRMYNPNNGDHHYTMSANERNTMMSAGWNYEGVGWYSADAPMTRVGLYRQFNPNAQVGSHNYAISVDEHVALVNIGWNPEGVAWYGLASESGYTGWLSVGGSWRYYQSGQMRTGWLVTDKPPAFAGIGGQAERYWLNSNGVLAVNREIDPSSAGDKDAEYHAYATGGGYLARNTSINLGGTWYYADNDGKLSVDQVVNRLAFMAQGYSSSSQYLLMVDIDNPRTVVFEGSQGNWRVKYVWDCCTGAPESPTVTGVFEVGIKGYSFGEGKGYSCYYYTQFYGDYLFHSRKYYPYTHTIKDGRMGVMVSEGCVRLYDEDAIWIQENVPAGTTVVTTR